MKLFILLSLALFLGTKMHSSTPHLFVASRHIVVDQITPTPTPSSTDVVVAITKEFEPEGKTVVKKMLDISFCESGWRWDAKNTNTNGSTDHGSLQINSVHTKRYGEGFKNNLQENVKVAHKIFKASGISPWVCSGVLGMK